MPNWIATMGRWFDDRLQVRATLGPMLKHPVPREVAGPLGWWYVFGSASLTLFLIQIATGIGLALVYVPSADRAYESLVYLNQQQPLGGFLRALHYYAGSGMVVMVLVHMTQVFLQGAYKYPRELTWLLGVCLLLCVLGMFFTGQILRWDPDAYWGLAVGGSMAGRAPLIGPALVQFVFGGDTIGGPTLSRFFALHVFVIPGALLIFLALHLWLVLKQGISAPPVPGKPVVPRTYAAEYEGELARGVPFLGDALWKDVLFSALAVMAVVVLAAVLGPKGPSGPVNPAQSGVNPRPEWPFLWLFALLSLSPPAAETFIILVFPLLLILVLFLVPFVSNRGERSPSRRPVAVLSVLVIYTLFGILTYQGATAPWSPQMDAWSSEPIAPDTIKNLMPAELMGSAVFQNKNCRNCHALDGRGGRRGPDLTTVGTRLTRDQLIDQVSNGTPGGGNMPAYGQQMSPAEMTTLVQFLVALRPPGRPAAQPASDPPRSGAP
ncbi:MAG TPA: cytochrome b N-terminal domain-containing protein [Pirellulales bacterium]|nr:cytochrome b N-terminal domain-containing protein [Pirellulales bacterium]